MSITLVAIASYAIARRIAKRREKMDPDKLLTQIENIVEKPQTGPVAVAPINWGTVRAQVTRASKRIKRHSAPNGVHEGVLMGTSPSEKAKRKAAARKAARTRKREEEKRLAAARKAARTKAREEEKRSKAAKKAARTRKRNEEKRAKAAIKGKATRTRNANKKAKAKAVAKGKRTKARKHGKK